MVCLNVGVLRAEDSDVEKINALPTHTDAAGIEFFEKRIRPLLANHCYDCHGEDEPESELRLDSYQGILAGGLGGPAIVPKKSQASLLVTAVRYIDTTLQMPPDEKLSEAEIADLIRWVDMGAPHPDADKMVSESLGEEPQKVTTDHWAFKKPTTPELPPIENQEWPSQPIDFFILQGLEAASLTPAHPADRRTLIRRATFDLTGLPPTREEIEAFLADEAPNAYERVIDRLLASPRYGEHWARHWLDVARYADSNGLDENVAQANAWRYRDYVINALNNDKPYDLFLHEQIAGDLLPSDDPAIRNERRIATGFLSLGPKVLAEVDEVKMQMDIVDEQIDTVGKAILGLTLGCARCHDHKFDPITQRDYYGLAGIFKSTHTMDSFKKVAVWHENSLEDKQYQAELAEHESSLSVQQSAIDQLIAEATAALQKQLGEAATLPEKPENAFPEATKQELKKLRDQLETTKKNVPEAPLAMGVKEGEIVEVPIHIRGSHLTLGEVASRSIPTVFATDSTPEFDAEGSGRLALAQWLTHLDNPLTARVMVNRVWRWHFGRGLVGTTDNFGQMGEAPTHAALLDWLATSLVREGWSLKQLTKQVMLSSTYQMSNTYNAQAAEADPQNQLYWRFKTIRLEAEQLRDAMLAMSDQLDTTMGGPSLKIKNRDYIFNHTSKDETDYNSKRRSIYLPVIRNHLLDSFTLFDYTDASIPNGNRNTSTVASQALYFMNSDFLETVSHNLANRSLTEATEDNANRVNWLYETIYGRTATQQETQRIDSYLSKFDDQLASSETDAEVVMQAWKAICQTMLMSSEFIYIR